MYLKRVGYFLNFNLKLTPIYYSNISYVFAIYLVVALDPNVREGSVQHGWNEVVADTFHLKDTAPGK